MKKNLKRREFLKKAGVAGAATVGASSLAPLQHFHKKY